MMEAEQGSAGSQVVRKSNFQIKPFQHWKGCVVSVPTEGKNSDGYAKIRNAGEREQILSIRANKDWNEECQKKFENLS